MPVRIEASIGWRVRLGCSGCQRISTTISATKLSALSAKASAGLVSAISKPPSAGPTLRAKLKAMVLSEIAWLRSPGPTCIRTEACHAGPFRAVPQPTRSVKPSSE